MTIMLMPTHNTLNGWLILAVFLIVLVFVVGSTYLAIEKENDGAVVPMVVSTILGASSSRSYQRTLVICPRLCATRT